MKSIQTQPLDLRQADQFCKLIAEHLQISDVVGLSGDLGSGKTTFVSRVANYLDIRKGFLVTSPTYVIHHTYEAKFPIHHIDFYRLESHNEVQQLGFEEFLGLQGVSFIEWFEKFPEIWKGERMQIEIEIAGPQHRKYKVNLIGEVITDRLKPLLQKLQDDFATRPK